MFAYHRLLPRFIDLPFWFILLGGLLLLLSGLFSPARAGVLLIEPAAPVVEVNRSVALSVAGATGTVRWLAEQGRIEVSADAAGGAVYTAPAEVGVYAVTVIDDAGAGAARVTVLPEGGLIRNFSAENAVWQIFTDRASIRALARAADGRSLWVGTLGGLEQRDAQSGQVLRVYTRLDGLPSNRISSVLAEAGGGLWIGMNNFDGGLAFRSSGGQFTVYQSDTSGLPDNMVTLVQADPAQAGALWIGTNRGGLAHFDGGSAWQVYDSGSGLPHDWVESLLALPDGTLWVGTYDGLARRGADGAWTAYTTQNSPLPDKRVVALLADGAGGAWIACEPEWAGDGTLRGHGLARLQQDGRWRVYTTADGLPSNRVSRLLADGQGGVLVGTQPEWHGAAWQGGGLLYYRSGAFKLFDQASAGLPGNHIGPLLADGAGGLWLGAQGEVSGLAHIHPDGAVEVFETSADGLPENYVYRLAAAEDGIWIGTHTWLAKYRDNGEWQVFRDDNSEIPGAWITALAADETGGVWAGINNVGLTHYRNDGTWQTYTPANSPLPHYYVQDLAADGGNGVWIASVKSGLAHLRGDGGWEIFDTGNSGLPANQLSSVLADGAGGVWIGTQYNGLAHYGADGSWAAYRKSASGLPSDYVRALLGDGAGGLWVGVDGFEILGVPAGVAHLRGDGGWESYTNLNSAFPAEQVTDLLADGSGGLWVGTYAGGLAHLSAERAWAVYDTRNSGLPDNNLEDLLSDGEGGLWAATWSGLGHLNFGSRLRLADRLSDPSVQAALLSEKRAAILLHTRGQGEGYSQAVAVDFMAGYAYHTLHARGYGNDEIYFLSYKPDMDFNGDAYADFNVVDGPVKLSELRSGGAVPRDLQTTDIDAAFAWAARLGKLDQPLLLVFVDHGLPGALLLEPLGRETLGADKLKALLDGYQQATGNRVAVVLEACHSGSLVSALQAPGRVIVSSTGEDLAYYDDLGRTSFLKFYFNYLRLGEDFWHAWRYADYTLAAYAWPLNQQVPRLEDSAGGTLAQSLCVNGCFAGLPGVLTLTPQLPGGAPQPGQSLELTAQTSIGQGSVSSVWASVITPEIAAQRDAKGYSRQPVPVVNLRAESNGAWRGRFSGFNTQGEYVFSFKARDNTGFIAEAPPITLLLAQGAALETPSFDGSRLLLPAVGVTDGSGGESLARVELALRGSDPMTLELAGLQWLEEGLPAVYANFDPASGLLYIPTLETVAPAGAKFWLSLRLQGESRPPRFVLESWGRQ